MNAKYLLISGSFFMALAVGFGAFGAHIVTDFLNDYAVINRR